jgi:hypothetical protein
MKTNKRMTESNSVGDSVLGELDSRLAGLEDRRKIATAEILVIEKRLKNVGTINLDLPNEPTLDDRARALLGGDVIDPAPAAPDDRRLAQLHRERCVIDRALEIGRSHAGRVRIAATAEVLARGDERWQANLRETALLAVRLRQLGAERRRLREEIAMSVGGIPTNLPFEFFQLGCGPSRGDEFARFLTLAVGAGIVSKEEVEHA